MYLTGNELTAASSVVAALAIAGGYLGVRSANQNALKVARQERESKREDELSALKRTVYVDCLAKLTAVVVIKVQKYDPSTPSYMSAMKSLVDAALAATNATAELELVAQDQISKLANSALLEVTQSSQASQTEFYRSFFKLQALMRDDLQGKKLMTPAELDSLADAAFTPVKPPEPDTANGATATSTNAAIR